MLSIALLFQLIVFAPKAHGQFPGWNQMNPMGDMASNFMGNWMPNFGNSMWPNSPIGGMPQGSNPIGQPSLARPINRPIGGTQPTRPLPGSQTPQQETGPLRNTAFWRNWFKNRDSPENFRTDAVNQNNSAGYETEEHCVYDLRMHYLFGSPDGVRKRMIGFNGQFPGPTLRCTQGKTMVVRVTNDMDDIDEPTSIHWHGIQQSLTPFYDGPQSVTQCPVIRDTSMIYKFTVFQAGTYWYHSHHNYQYVDGAWGFLVIKNAPAECWENSYDEERLISINDWYHRPARNISQTYLTRGNFPATNSSLINGRGTFNCSRAEAGQVCNPSLQGPAVVEVTRGKRYRFRILNSSAANTFNFSIDGHKMVVIETDGVDTVKSPKVDVIPILPAQRYSVIILMDQSEGEYWIRIAGEPAVVAGPPARAVLRYAPNPQGIQALLQPLAEPTQPGSGALQGRPDFNDIPWGDIMNAGGIKVPTREELQKYFPNRPPPINAQLQAQLDREHAQLVRRLRLPTSSPLPIGRAVVLDQNQCPPLQFGVDGGASARFDRLVVMNMTDCPLPGSPVRMCMNGEPYEPRSISSPPILYNLIEGIAIPDTARPIFTPNHQEVIRVVINNEHPFAHPWHLHGHSFWVLGAGAPGAGHFVASRDSGLLTTRGVRRDTTFTNAHSWAVISYVTDNPGVWFFHCHINWHLEAGLGMTFIESGSIARQIYKVPPLQSTQTCARVGVTL